MHAAEMNRAELQTALDLAEVRTDVYCLDGGYRENTLCLEEADAVWLVYFCERGARSQLGSFANENDACRDVERRLLKDSTTRIRYVPGVVPPW